MNRPELLVARHHQQSWYPNSALRRLPPGQYPRKMKLWNYEIKPEEWDTIKQLWDLLKMWFSFLFHYLGLLISRYRRFLRTPLFSSLVEIFPVLPQSFQWWTISMNILPLLQPVTSIAQTSRPLSQLERGHLTGITTWWITRNYIALQYICPFFFLKNLF